MLRVLIFDSERENFSWQFVFTLRVFAGNFVFCFVAWPSNPGFTSNKSPPYVLDLGDFENNITLFLITLMSTTISAFIKTALEVAFCGAKLL